MRQCIILACVFMMSAISTTVFAAGQVVVIPLNKKAKINYVNCPSARGRALAGPKGAYNFCWYLSEAGTSCDEVCSDMGGANLAYATDAWFADTCGTPGGYDIVSFFYNDGNPGNWDYTGTSTSYHTLGYGYNGGAYFGKCATGSVSGNGAYPGDANLRSDRNVVCPCFIIRMP